MFSRKALYILLTISIFSTASFAAAGPRPGELNAADFFSKTSPTSGIQQAIDALPKDGGTVFLPAGTYKMTRSINLRSGVILRGAGPLTVITRRDPWYQQPLTISGDEGDKKITVKDASGFIPGREIFIRSAETGGWHSTHAIITKINGNEISLDIPLFKGYQISHNPVAANFFPFIYAIDVKNLRVENLTVDGQKPAESTTDWIVDFTVSGIHFKNIVNSVISNVTLTGIPGDGFSIQGGDNTSITNCIAEHCLGNGLHPGTSGTNGIWADNIARFNGKCGLFFCWGIRHLLVQGNQLYNNKMHGIGNIGEGGSGDRYNIINANFCYNNGMSGIDCYKGGNNIVTNNVCENNSQAEPGRYPGIGVTDTFNTIISGNRCFDFQKTGSKTQLHGIFVTGTSRDNIIKDNIITGHIKRGIAGPALRDNIVKDNIISATHNPAGM